MKDKYKYSTSQLLNFAQDSYFERTSRPIYAIVFLLPFIVFYELGTILINTDVLNKTQVRVVAFVWLQSFLDEYVGLGSRLAWIAPPLVVVVILIALQLASRKRWDFGLRDIWPMAVECILLAVPLIVLSLLLNSPAEPQGDIGRFNSSAMRFRLASCVMREASSKEKRLTAENAKYPEKKLNSTTYSGSEVKCSTIYAIHNTHYDSTVLSCSSATGSSLSSAVMETSNAGVTPVRNSTMGNKSLLADIVTGIGAGIYEELVFRLILICILMLLFQDVLRLSRKSSIILSVLVSAALFSAHHHIVFIDGQLSQSAAFDPMEFGFRTIAGVYLAVLFAIRGFGITAGTHAFYDIIATVINTFFLQQ